MIKQVVRMTENSEKEPQRKTCLEVTAVKRYSGIDKHLGDLLQSFASSVIPWNLGKAKTTFKNLL